MHSSAYFVQIFVIISIIPHIQFLYTLYNIHIMIMYTTGTGGERERESERERKRDSLNVECKTLRCVCHKDSSSWCSSSHNSRLC